MSKESEKKTWYDQGLRFKCTACGKCCTGPTGYVWLSAPEIERMAKHLKLSVQDFSMKYLRYVKGRYALLETLNQGNYDCVFLKENQCQLYESRPDQCKSYPFWPSILSSEQSWKNEALRCEGISDEAPLVDLYRLTP